jgi:hypothetical protein
MTIDEISARLRARLQEEYGVDEAAILMDRPPGGWGDLVTNQSLDRRVAELDKRFDAIDKRFDATDTRFDLKLEALDHKLTSTMAQEFKAQTWRLTTAMLSSMAVLIAVVGTLVGLAKL